MKSNVKIFLLIIVLSLLATAAFSAPATALKKDKDSVSVSSTHYQDLLILKSGKPFMGSTVEVHDATGALIASNFINKKKMIIDFYNIPDGSYTVQVIRNKKTVLEFNLIKKQDIKEPGSEIFN